MCPARRCPPVRAAAAVADRPAAAAARATRKCSSATLWPSCRPRHVRARRSGSGRSRSRASWSAGGVGGGPSNSATARCREFSQLRVWTQQLQGTMTASHGRTATAGNELDRSEVAQYSTCGNLSATPTCSPLTVLGPAVGQTVIPPGATSETPRTRLLRAACHVAAASGEQCRCGRYARRPWTECCC